MCLRIETETLWDTLKCPGLQVFYCSQSPITRDNPNISQEYQAILGKAVALLGHPSLHVHVES